MYDGKKADKKRPAASFSGKKRKKRSKVDKSPTDASNQKAPPVASKPTVNDAEDEEDTVTTEDEPINVPPNAKDDTETVTDAEDIDIEDDIPDDENVDEQQAILDSLQEQQGPSASFPGKI